MALLFAHLSLYEKRSFVSIHSTNALSNKNQINLRIFDIYTWLKGDVLNFSPQCLIKNGSFNFRRIVFQITQIKNLNPFLSVYK